MMIKNFLFVALGGAIGSMLRYGLTLLGMWLSINGCWATLAANMLGSLLIGLVMPNNNSPLLLLYTVGLCGGFTTFSTFSLQTMRLLHDGQYLLGSVYIVGTTFLSLLMVGLGWYCRQRLF